jgi:putative membrane protein
MDGARPTSDSSARQILDERYARGELDTEEYRERLQTLGG